ncbi:DUF3953 domain-containing protein [Ureibacillus chungkukjangi]|uniref:DUF3953 domain-containing protein n=1 Tax=Ureibacillus chungkukjangi TaxID=1202712 RepID=UPI00203EAFD7|nr:DUF3953 domain-containing protein [Ureibacillus chungkukjangi]MCM3386933.1 DUF3953 domain-containing protein [Ureibacillus chungkukjangi]
MKLLKIILCIIVLAIAGYSLWTDEFGTIPILLLAAGLITLVSGVTEYQGKRKLNAYLSFLSAGFCIFVGVYIFFS